MSKITRAALAAMAIFLVATLVQFHVAPAANIALFAVPVVRTLFFGLLFAGAVALFVDVQDQAHKLADLAELHSFVQPSHVQAYKVAGIVSAASAFAFCSVGMLLARDMANMGLFSRYSPEALLYFAVSIALNCIISNALHLTRKRATTLERRLQEDTRQSWHAMP